MFSFKTKFNMYTREVCIATITAHNMQRLQREEEECKLSGRPEGLSGAHSGTEMFHVQRGVGSTNLLMGIRGILMIIGLHDIHFL